MKLSLVVPCYNEQDNVRAFYDAAVNAFLGCGYEYELVMVNDGSRDNTGIELKKLFYEKREETPITIVQFSRNFGKEAAILAGMKHAKGDLVTLIDADLQQRPEIVREMVQILDEHPEYDCVAAFQKERNEGRGLSFFKREFYRLINQMSEVEFVNGASDFRTCRRKMVDAILSMPEYHRFSKGIFSWVGFDTYYIPYVAEERHAGKTKWSFWKLFKYAVEGIIGYSTAPLKNCNCAWIIHVTSCCYLFYCGCFAAADLRCRCAGICNNCRIDSFNWRYPTFNFGNYGRIYSKNVYSGKTASYFYREGCADKRR